MLSVANHVAFFMVPYVDDYNEYEGKNCLDIHVRLILCFYGLSYNVMGQV